MNERSMKRRTLVQFAALAALTILLAATPAFAGSLGAARSAGQVGEQLDGYVGIAVSSPSADLRDLVANINARRKVEYRKIAKRNGTSVGLVGQLAAKQLIKKAPAGHLYQDPSGKWRRK